MARHFDLDHHMPTADKYRARLMLPPEKDAILGLRYRIISIIVEVMKKEEASESVVVARYADMFAALGAEPRLRILRLLLSAHPEGLVVGEILDALDIAPSTLSHHLEKLKIHELITVERKTTFLRYRANEGTLQELLSFMYAECCTRSKAVEPEQIVTIKKE